jgi:hypothetical protein
VLVACGYEHADVAASKENIDLVLKQMGKEREAKRSLTEAAVIFKATRVRLQTYGNFMNVLKST